MDISGRGDQERRFELGDEESARRCPRHGQVEATPEGACPKCQRSGRIRAARKLGAPDPAALVDSLDATGLDHLDHVVDELAAIAARLRRFGRGRLP